jgi:glycerol-3-phosphate dehydrogenase (NAD(P)+)
VGAGSWGTAVAALVAENAETVLWARRQELADELNREHTNQRYLPGFAFAKRLRGTASLEEAVSGADTVVVGVPSHGFRDVLREALPFLSSGVPIVSLSKGVEQESLQRMTEVIAAVAPGHPAGVLTGPNLAKEVMAGYPAATVIAFDDTAVAEELQPVFSRDFFRVYTNDDVVGCEIAGALKNVIAIAVGMADGMGFGDNTKAALITRGLAELGRLGVALGGNPLTFSGLAGMGDLVATCASPQSRNRRVGEELGKGKTLAQIVADMNMVAEGVKTSRAVVDLAAKVGVDMPIADQVVSVLYGGTLASEVVPALMTRHAGAELHGIT